MPLVDCCNWLFGSRHYDHAANSADFLLLAYKTGWSPLFWIHFSLRTWQSVSAMGIKWQWPLSKSSLLFHHRIVLSELRLLFMAISAYSCPLAFDSSLKDSKGFHDWDPDKLTVLPTMIDNIRTCGFMRQDGRHCNGWTGVLSFKALLLAPIPEGTFPHAVAGRSKSIFY